MKNLLTYLQLQGHRCLKQSYGFFSVFHYRSWTIEWLLIIAIYRQQKNLIGKATKTVL
jgi:hypothetical protein